MTARLSACLLLAGFVAGGCTKDQMVMQSGLPGARAAADLTLLKERGDYLDVLMQSGGFHYRFFLPDDEPCRALFAGEQTVTYANAGLFGRLQAGDAACDPIGILSLAAWRDRGPRRQPATVIPRSRSALRARVYVDEELVLVRGRFPLAGMIGFAGGADSIAVISNVPECEGLEVPGSASMEFRPAGEQPYTIVNSGRLCPVIGFVQVPPNP